MIGTSIDSIEISAAIRKILTEEWYFHYREMRETGKSGCFRHKNVNEPRVVSTAHIYSGIRQMSYRRRIAVANLATAFRIQESFDSVPG